CLDHYAPPRPVGGAEVTVHVQLDGNATGDPYNVLLDGVQLRWSTEAPAFCHSAPGAFGARPLLPEEAVAWCQPGCAAGNFVRLVEADGTANLNGLSFANGSCPAFSIPQGI